MPFKAHYFQMVSDPSLPIYRWYTYTLFSTFYQHLSTPLQNGCKDAGNQSETMYQDGKIFLIFLLKIFLILLLAEAEPIQAKHCNGEILAKEICIPKKYVDGIQNCPNSPPNNRIMAKMGNVQVIEVDDRFTVFDF